MATGRLPFRGASRTDTMYQILHGEPEAISPINPNSPQELERIVRKCLEKDLGLRYQHTSDLLADLKRLKRDTDSGKAASNREEVPTARLKVKWLALAIGTSLSLIALVAGLVFWFLHEGRETPGSLLVAVPPPSYRGE